jgi:hypothetical protein
LVGGFGGGDYVCSPPSPTRTNSTHTPHPLPHLPPPPSPQLPSFLCQVKHRHQGMPPIPARRELARLAHQLRPQSHLHPQSCLWQPWEGRPRQHAMRSGPQRSKRVAFSKRKCQLSRLNGLLMPAIGVGFVLSRVSFGPSVQSSSVQRRIYFNGSRCRGLVRLLLIRD